MPHGRESQYGFFIECKIIGRSKDNHTVHEYCRAGVRRFVTGQYAAAMPSGMMLAYVRDGRTVVTELIPWMSHDEAVREYAILSPPVLRDRCKHPIYVSRHSRSAVLVWHRHLCGEIELDHFWLQLA